MILAAIENQGFNSFFMAPQPSLNTVPVDDIDLKGTILAESVCLHHLA